MKLAANPALTFPEHDTEAEVEAEDAVMLFAASKRAA